MKTTGGTYYFLGIGGIGMSAIARYLHHCGQTVCGYDLTPSPLTDKLQEEGIAIHFDDEPSHIPTDTKMCIYTPAVPQETKLYQALKTKGIPIMKRGAMLGHLTESKKCIAVAGSHGKTTTSGMIAHILSNSAKGCSAFLGGISNNTGNNLITDPQSEYVVVEADEYDRSFLHLHPTYSVITATDPDHLDIYGTHEKMLESFAQYAKQTTDDGMLIIKKGVSLQELYKDRLSNAEQHSYAKENSDADYYAENIAINKGIISFDLHTPQQTIHDIELLHTAPYNIENAVAASAIALQCGVTTDELKKALKSFAGMKRRFEYHIQNDNIIYIDDYAHHPNEIATALQSIRALYPGKKITGIFQPHLYSRTADLADEFAEALSTLDRVILLPIYPAREKPIAGVSSEMILNKITNKDKHISSKEELTTLLDKEDDEIVLSIGAGDIDRLVPSISNTLQHKYSNR